MKFVVCLTLLFTTVCMAEPIVLFDSGITIPSYPYKQILSKTEVPDFGAEWALDKAAGMAPQSESIDPNSWLPIVSKRLTPGQVKTRSVRYDYLVSPICIIGSDAQSLRWIATYHSILSDNNVLCWLVSAPNIKSVQTVIDTLDGIAMSPADGDAISEFFGLSHYPVLITQRLIEQ